MLYDDVDDAVGDIPTLSYILYIYCMYGRYYKGTKPPPSTSVIRKTGTFFSVSMKYRSGYQELESLDISRNILVCFLFLIFVRNESSDRPGDFWAPDALSDQNLRMTEVGCLLSHSTWILLVSVTFISNTIFGFSLWMTQNEALSYYEVATFYRRF